MKKKRLAALVMAAALAAAAVTGCGSTSDSTGVSDSAESSGTESSETESSGGASEGTAASATDDSKYGGSVTINTTMEFTTAFPAFSTSTSNRFFVAPAIESLGRKDIEGNVSGWLAKTITADADAKTVTLELQDGIKFSDGSDFNAESVVWNFDKMVEGGKESELGTPASYEATDDMTVVLTYDTWANNLETLMAETYIYCPAAFEENGEDWAAINPVGTGPFVLKEYIQDDHITYTKNENYWRDGEPYLDEVTISQISDSTTQTSAFLNNEIDVLITSDMVVRNSVEAAGGVNIAGKVPDVANVRYVMFASGDKDSPFYDLKVRQAVMHAIEWDDTAAVLSGGYGDAITQFGIPGCWSYDDTVEFYTYDIDLAKQLLTEAGYPDGFDSVISTIDSNNDIAVVMQDACKEIGINLEIKTMTDADFNAEKPEGVYDHGMITGQGACKLDFTANYIRLYSSQGVNYKNMMAHPEDYEEALFGAQAAETLEEKKALLKEASKLMCSDYALIIPVAGLYGGTYTHGNIMDSGILEMDGVQWNPETIYRVD